MEATPPCHGDGLSEVRAGRGTRDRHGQVPTAAEHVTAFARMMTGRTGAQHLQGWLTDVEADDDLPALRTFARWALTGIHIHVIFLSGKISDLREARSDAELNRTAGRRFYGSTVQSCTAAISSSLPSRRGRVRAAR
ncbi:hypothetical protein ACWEPC_17755 [Nonomuraea sp. NPDC004297]